MSAASLEEAVAALTAGGVVAVPTDTVYGLVCDPSNAGAVERIYAIKRRPAGLELTLLAASIEELSEAVQLDEVALRLARIYWPGPLSIVAPLGSRRYAIPRDGGTLNTRIPGHPLLLEVLRRSGPLASTSANRHGRTAASSAADVAAQLGAEIDAVLDGGPAGGRASTIIDCSRKPPRVLREGPISSAELLAAAGALTQRPAEDRTRSEAE
jgi:L-threonylcarbamoyladenylate synthase